MIQLMHLAWVENKDLKIKTPIKKSLSLKWNCIGTSWELIVAITEAERWSWFPMQFPVYHTVLRNDAEQQQSTQENVMSHRRVTNITLLLQCNMPSFRNIGGIYLTITTVDICDDQENWPIKPM